jgi:hypothetical protein
MTYQKNQPKPTTTASTMIFRATFEAGRRTRTATGTMAPNARALLRFSCQ